jgi:hypothetical protein
MVGQFFGMCNRTGHQGIAENTGEKKRAFLTFGIQDLGF